MPATEPRRPDGTAVGPARATAAGVTAAQCLTFLGLGIATAITVGTGNADDSGSAALAASLWALAGVGLGLVAWALWRGRHWARSPSLVWQLLMLPVGWSLLDTQSVIGLVVLVSSAAALVSLLSLERDAYVE